METAENKTLVRRFLDEVLNGRDLAAIDRYSALGLVAHDLPPGDGPGREGSRAFYARLLHAFPDLRARVDLLIADGDRVAARITLRGTHLRDFGGLLATQREIAFSASHIFRCTAGRIVEQWGVLDFGAALQRAGLLDAPPKPPPAPKPRPPGGLPPI